MIEVLFFAAGGWVLQSLLVYRWVNNLQKRIRVLEDQNARRHNQLADHGMTGSLGRGAVERFMAETLR